MAHDDTQKTLPETCNGGDKMSDTVHETIEDATAIAASSAEKRLVRKLDRTLMPIVFILYMFNYLDRNNIAQAKLDSFEEDLNLTGDDFNLALSILNIPSNMILTRVRPSLYIPFWVCVWSCISAATAACHNRAGLISIRFFLGISEAPFFPGVFYLLSCWYTRSELALRYALLYSGLILATAVSGLLAAGIFSGLGGAHGLAGWQWLFIIEGAISFLLGLLAIILLPDFPLSSSKRWLFTEEERQVAITRMEKDAVASQGESVSLLRGLKLAALDYRVWIFALISCSNQSAYGFNYFYPAIVKGFELGSRTITLVCTAPPYLLGALCACFIAWSSDRRAERGYHIIVPVSIAIIGFIISLATLNIPARYIASFLYVCGCFSANPLLYSWAVSTLNQTPEKKACATAMINVIAQLGSVWSPYFFDPNDEPRYTRAMILLVAFAVLEMFLCVLMKWVLRRANRKMLSQATDGMGTPNLYTL